MSRIHDALKKAAEERNAQALNRSVSDLVDLTNEGLTVGVSAAVEQRWESQASVAERQPSVAERADAPPLKYEEFVKRCSRPVWKTEPYSNVFALQANDPVGAEKFRTLRSRLYQIAATQPVKRLLVTSSMPAEGKTFVAASLAQSIVRQTNRRVLLIDADLRASRLHLLLGAADRPGLTDYLRGNADEFQITQVGPSGNLCLIPGGQEVSNPSELLHSDPMKRLLDRMSSVFDWVILDSPPALAVHDASMIADMCDGVVFVIRAGTTAFEFAEKASAEFRKKNLLGVVLNGVQRGDTYDDYYYGYNSEKGLEAKP
jgi:protein-tyrosine kinase